MTSVGVSGRIYIKCAYTPRRVLCLGTRFYYGFIPFSRHGAFFGFNINPNVDDIYLEFYLKYELTLSVAICSFARREPCHSRPCCRPGDKLISFVRSSDACPQLLIVRTPPGAHRFFLFLAKNFLPHLFL